MTSTFLHEDKRVPVDEMLDRNTPTCEQCDRLMWLIKVETYIGPDGVRSQKLYECKSCLKCRMVSEGGNP